MVHNLFFVIVVAGECGGMAADEEVVRYSAPRGRA